MSLRDCAVYATIIPSSDLGECEEVAGSAEQCLFSAHLSDAPQQELTEAVGLFDLPEHRFDNLPL